MCLHYGCKGQLLCCPKMDVILGRKKEMDCPLVTERYRFVVALSTDTLGQVSLVHKCTSSGIYIPYLIMQTSKLFHTTCRKGRSFNQLNSYGTMDLEVNDRSQDNTLKLGHFLHLNLVHLLVCGQCAMRPKTIISNAGLV